MKKIGVLLFFCFFRAGGPLPGDPLERYVRAEPAGVRQLSVEKGAGIVVERMTFVSRGGRNTVFGIVASPVAKGRYPALLVFHGGSSCAGDVEGFVRRYAGLGYVAMAVDLPGICDPAKAVLSAGPWREKFGHSDARFDVVGGPDSSTLVDALAAALQAFNYLQQVPDVDSSRMGLTGFSWGGYTTTMLAGLLGARVKAAYAVFGCGFYDKGSIWSDTLAAMPVALRDKWIDCFDAGRRAGGIRCSYFIEASSNDKYFWPPAVMATLDAVRTTKGLVWGPNLDHVRLAGGDTMQQLYFDYWLKGLGKPFGEVWVAGVEGQVITAGVRLPEGVRVDSMKLYYAGHGEGRGRQWKELPMAGGRAELPEKGVDYFVYVSDTRGVKIASYIKTML
jgi:dienelactone hydrolase